MRTLYFFQENKKAVHEGENTAMDRKETILQAADALFAREGYSFSMSELAAAAGIRTPSLYSHFSGKDEIVELTVQREIAACRGQLSAAVQQTQSGPCRSRLQRLFWFLMAYFAQNDRLRFWKNIALIGSEEVRGRCAAEMDRQNHWFSQELEQYFRQGIDAGEIRRQDISGAVYLYYAMLLGLQDVGLLAGGSAEYRRQYAQQV